MGSVVPLPLAFCCFLRFEIVSGETLLNDSLGGSALQGRMGLDVPEVVPPPVFLGKQWHVFRPRDVVAHPLRFGNEANTGKTNLVGCCSTLQTLKGVVVLTL